MSACSLVLETAPTSQLSRNTRPWKSHSAPLSTPSHLQLGTTNVYPRPRDAPFQAKILVAIIRHSPWPVLTVASVAALLVTSATITVNALRAPPAFFVIQLTDPQFGLQHSNKAWSEERDMLDLAITQVNRLRPKFLILSGDLQNWFPTNQTVRTGYQQAADVNASLSKLSPAVPLKVIIPGNHDLGDAPTLSTLSLYQRRWGADRMSFDESKIRFIAIDASLYFDASEPGVQAKADEQTSWLSRQLDEAPSSTLGTVLVSHIPPFIVDHDESSGWANWPKAVRDQVLSMSQTKAKAPSLMISGHFHGNVEEVRTDAYGTPLEVVTTSSCGCPIQWNGTTNPVLSHELAKGIAAEQSGYDAFMHWVAQGNMSRVHQRIRAVATIGRTALRV